MILIDTASIHNALKALHKELDYHGFVTYLQNIYKDYDTLLFVNASADGFIRHLESIKDLKFLIIKKEATKKKMGDTRVWYLSFAVDMVMSLMQYRQTCELLKAVTHEDRSTEVILVTTDIDVLPVLRCGNIKLYGLGIPRLLREQCQHFEIPNLYLKELK